MKRKILDLIMRRRRYLDVDKNRLSMAFAVDPELPLLRAVEFLHVQAEEVACENGSQADLAPGERDFYAGYQACARELQEKVAAWVDAANKQKLGVVKVDLPE